jgi:type II pantothenate kinase
MSQITTNPHAPVNPDSSHTLPQLLDPGSYRACVHDLLAEPEHRAYWLALFRNHYPSMLDEAVREALDRGISARDAAAARDEALRQFGEYLDLITADPGRFGRLDGITICYAREHVLRSVGFLDTYRLAKARENATALPMLPPLLQALDALPPRDRIDALVRGAFAGNIFDLGAVKTAALFQNGSVKFADVLARLKPRPWLVDDLDLFHARLARGSYRRAVVFVDNAGPDILLGMIPFARELVVRGGRVIITANSTPTLNDVTADELRPLLAQIAGFDDVIAAALRDGSLRVIASGNGIPLIDLRLLSGELVQALRQNPPDLVVLEGMGRSLESNFNARFACDALKIAMIKDPGVAGVMGGSLYDLVMRFEPVG